MRLLNARLLQTLRTPGRARTVFIKRGLAIALLILAAMSAINSHQEHPATWVFAADFPAGHIISDGDITLARLPQKFIPHNAVKQAPLDSVVIAAAGKGEIVTKSRILGPEYTSLQFSHRPGDPRARKLNLVPLTLAQPDIVGLLHHGDEVSIIAPDSEDLAGRVIAPGGHIVLTTLPGQTSSRSGTVLIALPPQLAKAVAAASLDTPLTVIVTGARADNSNPQGG